MLKPAKINIAINGFGRIGRNVLRAYFERLCQDATLQDSLQIVAINDLADAETLLHLLKYDSTHGRLDTRFPIVADVVDNQLHITTPHGEQAMAILHEPNPSQLPWQALGVAIVLESTGIFRSYDEAYQHITAGARQVIVGAAPFDRVDASIVLGVNDHELSRDKPILSGVSCTTQALVPLLAVLDEAFGVQSAMLTEIHAVTADQNVLDQVHRDLRRARASGHNIIPTTSSSINAVGRVLPKMIGKINGYSIRVPTIDVAGIDVTFSFAKPTSVEAINALLKQKSEQNFVGIMGYTDEPLVSSDFIHESASLIVDGLQTMQTGAGEGTGLFKVFAWYDNEWGYANRMLDICRKLALSEH
ncbi:MULTISPECIES: type I glyceraldehyde-3-phosphate dehydrogenase [unclassified Moraxella]|uniref:type I glyceraldehyde-3-phosphate dehydrogenase n=1 Tax=unclassified Moraxella TaxID=2685852 RepID=UPI003AF45F13